jgi:hypothetical protein
MTDGSNKNEFARFFDSPLFGWNGFGVEIAAILDNPGVFGGIAIQCCHVYE